jgi:hypothetical protein
MRLRFLSIAMGGFLAKSGKCHIASRAVFIILGTTFCVQASVIYSFNIATNSPINPIHFSFAASVFLGTQSGPLSITPFNVSDTLGDSWTFTNGLINVSDPTVRLACFAIFAPPAVGDPSLCGAIANPPGGGVLFIEGPFGGPISLPANDGVFPVETTYALVKLTSMTFNGIVPTTMTVTSVPEPASGAAFFIGLIAVLVLVVRSAAQRTLRTTGSSALALAG